MNNTDEKTEGDEEEFGVFEHGTGLFTSSFEFRRPKTTSEFIELCRRHLIHGVYSYEDTIMEHIERVERIFPDTELMFITDDASGKYGEYSIEWYSAYIVQIHHKILAAMEGSIFEDGIIGEINFGEMDNFSRLQLSNSWSFQIGMIAMEARAKFEHEAAALEGYRHKEGRSVGQPLAARARKKAGDERRETILRLAREQIDQDPSLAGNMSQLATAILKTDDPGLSHKQGLTVSHAIVRKRLTEFRKDGSLWESS